MSTSYKWRETLLKMATALLSWLHWNLILFSGSFLSDVLEEFEECTFVVLNEIKWCRPREKLTNRREIYNWVSVEMECFSFLLWFVCWTDKSHNWPLKLWNKNEILLNLPFIMACSHAYFVIFVCLCCSIPIV
jgi:hypothetical protein